MDTTTETWDSSELPVAEPTFDQQIRLQALSLAVSAPTEPGQGTVDRAQAFYEFLKGES